MGGGWIDVSIPLEEGITVWPGDPALEIVRFASIAAGDGANVTRIAMSAHTGTHVDAPLHFIDSGGGVGNLALDAMIGPAVVLDVGDRAIVDSGFVEGADLGTGERVLLRTRNSRRRWWREAFREDYVCLGEEAAAALAERGVRLVGVDGPSVGAPGEVGDRVHEILLGAGVCLVEGLDLSAVAAGRYELICLPLPLVTADGAPARALLRPILPR
jgi:arylformamidase